MTTIEMIPVSQIRVLNPRARNKLKFQEVQANIAKVGLKKPITVVRRKGDTNGYDLVCGQGRFEACVALGQPEVPAIVREATKHECYIMSLAENLARCRHSPMDLVREIETLRGRGYSQTEIAAKIGITDGYVSQLVRLLENGEERLIAAVERGEIPMVVAMDIAAADDAGVQLALADAYTTGKLRGKGLVAARRLIELRRMHGKGRRLPQGRGRGKTSVSTDDVVRTYRKQTQRQQLLVKKARVCETRLVFIAGALKQLFTDDAFVKLLRAESLDTIPEYLADSIRRSSR